MIGRMLGVRSFLSVRKRNIIQNPTEVIILSFFQPPFVNQIKIHPFSVRVPLTLTCLIAQANT